MVKYMITNGHGSYIRLDQFTNKYVPVKCMSLGDVWDQRHIATNILKNCLGKKDRRKYKILEIDSNDNPGKSFKTVSDSRKEKEAFAKSVAAKDIGQDRSEKWSSGVGAIHELVKDAEERREELSSELAEVEKEILDIRHYIEFTSLNAYQGWLACNMLKNRLMERRRIKNELEVITALGNCKITSDMMADIENAIDAMKNKKYTPRVLFELFK